MKVAVIGLGVIGKSQTKLYKDYLYVTYDVRDAEPYPLDLIGECDFAVICVGTPQAENGEADLTALYAAIDAIPWHVPIMVRSTVPPGTIAALEKERPLIVHVPEFMYESDTGMWPESSDVPFTILGGLPQACEYFYPYVKSPVFQCTGLEAEMIKYTANMYLATKVTFMNEVARACAVFGADCQKIEEGWKLDPRSGISHTHVNQDDPGFGGRCLPKDLSAFIYASRKAGYRPKFLEAVQETNKRFRKDIP